MSTYIARRVANLATFATFVVSYPTLLLMLIAVPARAGATIIIDGTAEAGYGVSLAVQDTPTGVGDSTLGQVDLANGSELDAAYGIIKSGVLYVTLAGNLESNFKKLEIFIDTIPGGQNKLRGDNANVDGDGLNRMGDDGSGNGLTFDVGFAADYWIGVSGGDVGGGAYGLQSWYAVLVTSGGGPGYFLGQGGAVTDGTLTGGTNPNNIRVTINNSNTAGVTTSSASGAASVTKGIELAIPFAAIGNPPGATRICTFINAVNHDSVSNQVLSGIGGGANLGEPRTVNLQASPLNQSFPVSPFVPPPTTLVSPNEEVDGYFGNTVAGVPDLNDDGVTDIVVGAVGESPGASPTLSGRAHIFSGATGLLLRTLASPNQQTNGFFGRAVSGVADVNADGWGDVIIGAPGESVASLTQAGRAYLYCGATGDLLATFENPQGPGAFDTFGQSVSGVPDVDGVAGGDIVIGARNHPLLSFTAAGGAYVFSGTTGALLHILPSPNAEGGGQFGDSVSGVPDVDGDGRGDVVVGAPAEDPGSSPSGAGRAYIFSGATGSLLTTLVSPNETFAGSFGFSVSAVPDVDGDPYADVVVGARYEITVPDDAGRAYVYSGSDGCLLQTLESPNVEADGNFGHSVSGIPDLNGDARGDLVIGAWHESPGGSPQNVGRAYVFSGADTCLLAVLATPTPEAFSGFGVSVAGVEDMNGDGLGDILVGTDGEDPGSSPNNAGRAYIYTPIVDMDGDGLPDDQDNCPVVANPGQQDADGDRMGDACDSCTDTDGDGFGNPGFPANNCPSDNCPAIPNVDQSDGDNDGSGDACDLCPGFDDADDCDMDGTPDGCEGEPDCNGNGIPDSCDMTSGFSQDCNRNAVPDECDIADCPPHTPSCDDCNSNGVPDECDIANGTSEDCQPDGIPDECQDQGMVISNWVGGIICPTDQECWTTGANWCPAAKPDNQGGTTFDVTIDGAASVVTLDTSPTITALALTNEAGVIVNDASGANVRTLAVDSPIASQGVFRATDRERLVLDAPEIDQGGVCGEGGVLEATDGAFDAPQNPDPAGGRSILQVTGSKILGGTARTIGTDSEIHLVGGAELVNVCISGVVVPDGQIGQFSGTVTNDDELLVSAASAFTLFRPTSVNAVLDSATGSGSVHLTDQDLAQLGSGFVNGFTNSATHRIDGAGTIVGKVINNGQIDGNIAGQALFVLPPGSKTNNGVLRGSVGGTLYLGATLTQSSSARIEAIDGGTVVIEFEPVTGTGGLSASGGTISIQSTAVAFSDCIEVPPVAGETSAVGLSGSTLTATGGLPITGGTVTLSGDSDASFTGPVTLCPNYGVDPSAVAVLNITDAASTLTAGAMSLCAGGTLNITGAVTLNGPLAFSNTVESEWTWAPSAKLVMNGGAGATSLTQYAKLEIGGSDLGDDPANHIGDPDGFMNNFDLSELLIGPGAKVTLLEVLNNGNRIDVGFGSDEALYVDTLTFADAAGQLNLNGLHLYYSTLNGMVSQIVDQSVPFGDADNDGDVELSELALFLNCYTDSPADVPRPCTAYDFDDDDDVDLIDFNTFNLTGPP